MNNILPIYVRLFIVVATFFWLIRELGKLRRVKA